MDKKQQKYHKAAIAIHWIMALCIFTMLIGGMVMTNFKFADETQMQLYGLHKSIGVTLILAIILRVIIRIITTQPELPAKIKGIERKLAKLGHFALYALMVIMPLSGWLLVSSSPYGYPTIVFGMFEWPHIPNIAKNKDIFDFAVEAHEFIAYSILAVVIAHIAAVVKHALKDGENLLPRMSLRKKL